MNQSQNTEESPKSRRKYRAIESRRLSLIDRTQRFIDNHPEFFSQYAPQPYTPCRSCGASTETYRLIDGCCCFECLYQISFTNPDSWMEG